MKTKETNSKTTRRKYNKIFDKIATKATRATGSATTFILATLLIVVWLVTGPLFDYSDTWQLIINTSTTIVTFLMVFLIQQSQNKDTTAIQLKLNELIACNAKASNRLIDIEDLTDDELQMLKKYYIHLSKLSAKESNLFATHSIDDANKNHASKNETTKYYGRKNQNRKRLKPVSVERNGSSRNPAHS